MSEPRNRHTATLLPDGKVLVTGGYGSTGDATASAEIYDPATGRFSLTGPLTMPRAWHTATLLRNGKVLIAGGITGNIGLSPKPTAKAELFDPTNSTFRSTYGQSSVATASRTATLLDDGTVLLAGGTFGDTAAEVYDPATDTFAPVGPLQNGRLFHTATKLLDGRVLIAGGRVGGATCEVYDPVTRQFLFVGSMTRGREFHSAALLASGQVLVTGGAGADAELFHPDKAFSANAWSPAPNMTTVRSGNTSTVLPTGNVLIVGGSGDTSVELYDVSQAIFKSAGNLVLNFSPYTATLLQTGQVLIVAGDSSASAELFTMANASNLLLYSVVPAVASAPGAFGSIFVTALQLHNSSQQTVRGQLAFRQQASGFATPTATLDFTLPAGTTQVYANVLDAMQTSGVGSLDLLASPATSQVVASAHVFNRASDGSTTGFVENAFRPTDALHPGETGVIFGPDDVTRFRFNVGVRTLADGATVHFVARDLAGSIVGDVLKTYPANWFEQVGAQVLLNVAPTGGMTVTVTITSGNAFVYGAVTDNVSNDPAIQFAILAD